MVMLAWLGKNKNEDCIVKIQFPGLSLCSAWILVARFVTADAGAGKKTFGKTFYSPVFTKLSLASDISSRLKFSWQRQLPDRPSQCSSLTLKLQDYWNWDALRKVYSKSVSGDSVG